MSAWHPQSFSALAGEGEKLISTHKPLLSDAIHPQPTCTSVTMQPWICLVPVNTDSDNEFGIGG